MPRNSVRCCPASQGVITHSITWQFACRTKATRCVHRHAKSVLQHWDELRCAKVKTKRGRRHNGQSTACVGESKGSQSSDLSFLTLLGDVLKEKRFVGEINFQACHILAHPCERFQSFILASFCRDEVEEGLGKGRPVLVLSKQAIKECLCS